MKNPAAVALGRLGGQATSEAKTRAVRQNAKLGGWPKGRKRKKTRKARTQNESSSPTAADGQRGAERNDGNI